MDVKRVPDEDKDVQKITGGGNIGIFSILKYVFISPTWIHFKLIGSSVFVQFT